MKGLSSFSFLGGFGLAAAIPYSGPSGHLVSRSPKVFDPDIFLRDLSVVIPRVGHPESIATLSPPAYAPEPELHERDLNLTKRVTTTPPPGTVFLDLPNGYTWDRKLDNLNEGRKEKVSDAWGMAFRIVNDASTRLKEFADFMDNAKLQNLGRNGPKERLALRSLIAQVQPAVIHDNVKKLAGAIENVQADGRNGQLIYMTALDEAHNLDDIDQCAATGGKTTPTIAFVLEAAHFKQIQDFKKDNPNAAAQLPDDAIILNFCAPFFKMTQSSALFYDLANNHKSREEVCSLNNHDSTAKVMIHEWTHFAWTLDTNRPDDPSKEVRDDLVGLPDIASRAYTGGKAKKDDQKPRFSSYTSKNADTYAWFMMYDFLNNAAECQGIQWKDDNDFTAGCTDTWTPGAEKFTKNKWQKAYSGST